MLRKFNLKNLNMREFNNFFVGALIAVCLTIFGTLTVAWLYHIEWGVQKYTLYCNFEKGLGLRKGAKVQVNGVDVGQVKGVMLKADGTVTLVLSIKHMFSDHITETSRAFATRDQNLISDRVINITHGEGGRILQDRETIYADDAQDIETLLSNVVKLMDKIEHIAISLDTMVQMSLDPRSTVGALLGSRELYNKIDDAVNMVGGISTRTNDLINGVTDFLPPLLAKVDTLTGQFTTTAGNLMELSGRTNGLMDNLDTTVSSLNAMLGDFGSILKYTKALMIDGEQQLGRVDDLVSGISKMWLIRDKIPKYENVPVVAEDEW